MRTTLSAAALALSLIAAPAFASDPFIANDVKYKETVKPATGRSGDASIEALALLGKDGATDVQITAAGGTIDKVQLKLPGDVTHNYNQPGGTTFAQRVQGLPPGSEIGVQVNVAGDTRVGVVSAAETVKRRPDLMVVRVDAPPHALAGAPYHLTALVREGNGDFGARANCVLLSGGVEVDRAERIWVDAGGTVSCEMAYTFRNAGDHQLSVAVTGVEPGDYDGGNNASAPVAVRVYQHASEMEVWQASAFEEDFQRRSWWKSPTAESETIHYGWSAGVSFWAWFYWSDLNVENLRASVQASTDGRVIHEIKDVQFRYETGYDRYEDTTRQCSVARIDGRLSTVAACRYTSPWEGRYVTFVYRYNGGEVTYISRGWSKTYIGGVENVYYWNEHLYDQYGTRFDLGENVTVSVQFSDGTRYFDERPTMSFYDYNRNWQSPDTCWTWGSDQYCSGYTDIWNSRDAVAGNW